VPRLHAMSGARVSAVSAGAFEGGEHAIDGRYGSEEVGGHRSAPRFGEADAGLKSAQRCRCVPGGAAQQSLESGHQDSAHEGRVDDDGESCAYAL
jgi:hypothetical protein